MKNCFCGRKMPYSSCCAPLIFGKKNALTAEELMRSRYSAYVVANVDYLFETTHHSKRDDLSRLEIKEWAKSNNWQCLEIIHAEKNIVEFKAYFKSSIGVQEIHHEKSIFCFENDIWYYLDGIFFN